MIYAGACHCGAVRAAYETNAPVRLRHDGCAFCASRGVKSASDANGKLALTSTQRLTRYRFGHKTADFLICPARRRAPAAWRSARSTRGWCGS